jgi:hypothetical protein
MTDEEPGHPEIVDMSPYEAMLRDEPTLGLQGEHEEGFSVDPARRRPNVEWAIAWGDGSLTPVSAEHAARRVASLDAAWTVVCRIVGGWDHA